MLLSVWRSAYFSVVPSDGASSGKGRVEGCAIKTHHRSIYSMGLNQDRFKKKKKKISWELKCYERWYMVHISV